MKSRKLSTIVAYRQPKIFFYFVKLRRGYWYNKCLDRSEKLSRRDLSINYLERSERLIRGDWTTNCLERSERLRRGYCFTNCLERSERLSRRDRSTGCLEVIEGLISPFHAFRFARINIIKKLRGAEKNIAKLFLVHQLIIINNLLKI